MMRRIPAAVVLAVAIVGTARADAPAYLPVQGVLADLEGVAIDEEVSIRFALYTADIGGAELWFETQTVLVEDGFFTAYLGDSTALDLATFRDNGTVWLGVTVGSDFEMLRIQLATTGFAAFAQYAGNAGTLDGHDAAYFATSGGAVDWSVLTNVPDGLGDGDADSLAALECTDGQVVRWISSAWGCGTDDDSFAALECTDGQIIEWSGSGWICGADDDSFAALECTDGQVPKWSGSDWGCGTDEAGTGDLTDIVAGNGIAVTNADGPSPTIAVADDGITTSMLKGSVVDSTKIADGSIQFADWAAGGCTTGQSPEWDGTAWVCGDDLVGFTSEADLTALLDDNYLASTYVPDWSDLTGIPSGIADGDDDTTYTAGPGLTLTDTEFAVDYDGNGTAETAARSDHSHDGLDCPTGWWSAAGGRVCFEPTVRTPANAWNAIAACAAIEAHVCLHTDMQQLCGAGFNPFQGRATGWFGDHGPNDNTYHIWNNPNCVSDADGVPAGSTAVLPYSCCM